MNGSVIWLLGILGGLVATMGAAWAIWIMKQLNDLGLKVDNLAKDVNGYSKGVDLFSVAATARVTAIEVRVEGNELKIKALERPVNK